MSEFQGKSQPSSRTSELSRKSPANFNERVLLKQAERLFTAWFIGQASD